MQQRFHFPDWMQSCGELDSERTGKYGRARNGIPESKCLVSDYLASAVRTRTTMKCGWALSQASAFSFVWKKRSMTIAFRSAAIRPDHRAALRLTTPGPVSTAMHSP